MFLWRIHILQLGSSLCRFGRSELNFETFVICLFMIGLLLHVAGYEDFVGWL